MPLPPDPPLCSPVNFFGARVRLPVCCGKRTVIAYCKAPNLPGSAARSGRSMVIRFGRVSDMAATYRSPPVSFIPAVSDKAAKRMRLEVRRWRMHLRSDLELEEIAKWARPHPCRVGALLWPVLPLEASRVNSGRLMLCIVRWVSRKYKRSSRAHYGGLGLVTVASAPQSDPVRTLGHGISGWMMWYAG